MVACVDEDAPPPPELSLAWKCERWHALPETGAVVDQDARLMFRMSALSNIYNTLTRYRNLQGEQIHTLTEQDRKLMRLLIDNGLFNG